MPQTKKKGGKASTVTDGVSTEEMTRVQLQERIVSLREELEREREERCFFQLERERALASCESARRRAEETEARLRREQAEAEERHRVEINVYKQRLQQIKMDAAPSSLMQRSEVTPQRSVSDMKKEHQVDLMELQKDYDRRLQETEQKLHLLVERRTAEVLVQLEKERTNQRQLTQDQRRTVEGLKMQLKKANRALVQTAAEARQDRRVLKEQLEEAEQKLLELQRQVENRCAQNQQLQKDLRGLREEQQLLLLAFQRVQQERDELLRGQTQNILDLQNRSSLKKLQLEQKLSALTRTLERQEARLGADPLTQEVLESKWTNEGHQQKDLDQNSEAGSPDYVQDNV